MRSQRVRKGQGGEGLSKGYGGSGGRGTGPSGPETDKSAEKPGKALPSRKRIAEVLR
jgi:hypothetical protein